MRTVNLPHDVRIGVAAAIKLMMNVRPYQFGKASIGEVQIKASDGTALTRVDQEGARIAEELLLRELPTYRRLIEDSGRDEVLHWNDPAVLLVDPVDGTRPFSIGIHTSTVIVAGYDPKRRNVTWVAIGEPISGSVIVAYGDTPTQTTHYNFRTNRLGLWTPTQVKSGNLGPKATILLDASDGFVRKGGRQILTNEQVASLFAQMAGKGKVLMSGSNGEHYMLVALGGADALITTAIGGPWDIAGVLAVLRANGYVIGFRIHKSGQWVRNLNPLDVMEHDIVIAACSKEVAEQLAEILMQVCA